MRECFDDLFNTNPRYVSTLSFILGLLLIDNLTAAEQNVVGNFLEAVGQIILANAASQGLIENRIHGNVININSKEVKCIYNPAVYNIDKIKEIIKEVYPNNTIDLHILRKAFENIINNIDKITKDN